MKNPSINQSALNPEEPSPYNWKIEDIVEILEGPLLDLLSRAQACHREFQPGNTMQLASLVSIKTGACPEDCKYCSQSAHYTKKTGLKREALMDVEAVLAKAREAKDAGATRFCMGAAWRQVRDGKEFENVLEMVRGVCALEMEACVTLGMLTQEQADKLASAGLTAYNHNLDTSPEFYGNIVTTRTYDDRLKTLERVRQAGISVCSGGILGLGESIYDRARMLQELSSMDPYPESVPINTLVAVPGTPLEDQPRVDPIEIVRVVATARIVMPRARIRLSAGRRSLSDETQILCFLAGANSIFYGEKLLTTDNNDAAADRALIEAAGLKSL